MAFSFHKWDKEKILEGVYVGLVPNVGPYRHAVYVFEVDGKERHIWSSAQLMDMLRGLPFKTRIRLTYCGMEEMPDDPKKKYNKFTMDILEVSVKKKPTRRSLNTYSKKAECPVEELTEKNG